MKGIPASFSQTFNSHSPHKRSAKAAFGLSKDFDEEVSKRKCPETMKIRTPTHTASACTGTTPETAPQQTFPVHSSTSSFLPCHLRVLKALYANDDGDSSNGNWQEDEHSPDYNVWKYIDMFLQRRGYMEQCNTKTNNLSGILEETERILAKNSDPQSIKKKEVKDPTSSIPDPKSSLNVDCKQYQHPVVLSFCTQSQQFNQATKYLTPSGGMMSQSFLSLTSPQKSKIKGEPFPSCLRMSSFYRFRNSQDSTRVENDFNFLAFNHRMLKKRYTASDRMVKKEFLQPFLPLVKDVKERIDALEEDYKVCKSDFQEWEGNDDNIDHDSFGQAHEFEDNQMHVNYNDDHSETVNKLCDLKLKLGLWKRLDRSIDSVVF